MSTKPRLSTDSDKRKDIPLVSGVLDYFPDALAAVAELSKVGNDKHNPGQPLHWSRDKSTDHADCIARHLLERGTVDTDGIRHSVKVAWRALAMLQVELEEANGLPPSRGSRAGEGAGPKDASATCACLVWSKGDGLHMAPVEALPRVVEASELRPGDRVRVAYEQADRHTPAGDYEDVVLSVDGGDVDMKHHLSAAGGPWVRTITLLSRAEPPPKRFVPGTKDDIKVGARVRLVADDEGCTVVGEVTEVKDDGDFTVRRDDGKRGGGYRYGWWVAAEGYSKLEVEK